MMNIFKKSTLELPKRLGSKPETTSRAPHRQLDQIPDKKTVEAFVESLIEDEALAVGAPHSSVDDGRSLKDAKTGQHAYEFGHVHDATDGSLHLHLAQKDIQYVTEQGWGEPHPSYRPAALIFAPRNLEEMKVVTQIVHHSRLNMKH